MNSLLQSNVNFRSTLHLNPDHIILLLSLLEREIFLARLSDDELIEIAEELIDQLPEDIRDSMGETTVAVQSEPTTEQIDRARAPVGSTLFGLYEGVPMSKRSVFAPMMLPAQITLFRGPLERRCRNRAEIRERIRTTLFHEIGHHLGFNESELRRRGL